MKVSIVVPVYNGADTLAETLWSAKSQTYKDKEIIVVDDGSTDSSLLMAKLCYDPPVTDVIHQTNQGLPSARNTGIKAATGDLILPLDADDKIAPDYLEKTVPLMTAGVGVVSTDMIYFGTHDMRIRPLHTTLEQAMHFNGIPVCSLIRREALEQAEGYNLAMTEGCEDWELWIDILKHGWKIAVLNEPLFFYRRKSVSMVSKMDRNKMIQVIRSLHPELSWS